MHLLTCPPHHPEIQGCSPQIVTNKSTNPLIQNNFALKKLEVGLTPKPDPDFDTKCADICAVYQAAPTAAEQDVQTVFDRRK